jgi:hypothetical protein
VPNATLVLRIGKKFYLLSAIKLYKKSGNWWVKIRKWPVF